jgi:phytoene dehydrogenase-like protein
MKKSIEAIEGKDGFERYLSFLQESHRHYEISAAYVLRRNFSSFLNMARPEMLLNLLALHPFQSIWTRASKYFWTERLRRVFTFGTMYMGMSPFDAPATYSLLQYTELAEGILYPKGGFHRVSASGLSPRFNRLTSCTGCRIPCPRWPATRRGIPPVYLSAIHFHRQSHAENQRSYP